MTVLQVIQPVLGWKVGDLVEADTERAKELVAQGVVTVVSEDPKEEVEPIVEPEVVNDSAIFY